MIVEPVLGKTELQTFPSPGLTTINILTMNTPIPSKKYWTSNAWICSIQP